MEAISMHSTKKGNKWWTNIIYEPIYRVSESEMSDLNAGQETNLPSLPPSSREAQLPSNSPTERLLYSLNETNGDITTVPWAWVSFDGHLIKKNIQLK